MPENCLTRELTSKLHAMERRGRRELERFHRRMAKHGAATAFEASSDAFKAAAAIHVAHTVLAWLETAQKRNKLDTYDAVYEVLTEIQDVVMTAARSPERSASLQANVLKQEITAAYAEVLAGINW